MRYPRGVYEHNLALRGCAIATDVVPPGLRDRLVVAVAHATTGVAGNRWGLGHEAVRELATSAALRELVEPILGVEAFAVRATLFDKTPQENWFVAWHQDLAIPVQQMREVPGFGPWSVKDGVPFVQPPAEVLRGMLAVRVDLDGSDAHNGALRVLPGTHTFGVLTPKQRSELSWAQSPVICEVPAGGALVMRPLLLHSSGRAASPLHRGVVHLEFAAHDLPGGLEWQARVR